MKAAHKLSTLGHKKTYELPNKIYVRHYNSDGFWYIGDQVIDGSRPENAILVNGLQLNIFYRKSFELIKLEEMFYRLWKVIPVHYMKEIFTAEFNSNNSLTLQKINPMKSTTKSK